jgi:tRNA(fMet)-specific endonuclease VapC
MGWLLDTSVVVHLVEGNMPIVERVAALTPVPVISVATRVELEAGVFRLPIGIADRRRRLDETLEILEVLPFGDADAARYGLIIADIGFSRRQIFDRMIAAHAITLGLTLVSMNGADFSGIAGLSLLAWS